jgi:hypothetical protein
MRCTYERGADVWHAAVGDSDSWFQPIACGEQDGSGITLPWPWRDMEPTCPSCRKALKAA